MNPQNERGIPPLAGQQQQQENNVQRPNVINNFVNQQNIPNYAGVNPNNVPARIKVVEALAIVDEYSGYNLSLNSWILQIQRAHGMLLPCDRRAFVLRLISKLSGEAKRSIQNRAYENLEDLINHFRRIYRRTES